MCPTRPARVDPGQPSMALEALMKGLRIAALTARNTQQDLVASAGQVS